MEHLDGGYARLMPAKNWWRSRNAGKYFFSMIRPAAALIADWLGEPLLPFKTVFARAIFIALDLPVLSFFIRQK